MLEKMQPAHKKKFRPGHVALERALSKLGIASRTVARRWILAGQVRVNGVIRTNPEFSVHPESAQIEIAGEKAEVSEWRMFLLNKPRGLVTTHSDEKGRKTVFSLFEKVLKEELTHLIAVGRLDQATSGLLLVTNDTRLAAWLTDPSTEIPRTYLVTVRGRITPEKLAILQKGIRDQGEWLKPESVELRKESGRESHLTVVLKEGKNREIRRLFESIGNEVTRLKRVAYGPLELGELEPGAYRELGEKEFLDHFPAAPVGTARSMA